MIQEEKMQNVEVEEMVQETADKNAKAEKPSKVRQIFKITVYAFLTIVLILVAAALANA